jgi:hypothetical protein
MLGENKMMLMVPTQENWIPILDYAVSRGISTSTLRRYIKAKKIQYKIENGRYLILADDRPCRVRQQPILSVQSDAQGLQVQESISVFAKVRELEAKLLGAEEQISELKMLVAIYEEKLAQSGH